MPDDIYKDIKDKFKDFLSEYNYDENPFNNIYSIYDLTDFIQLNLKDNERIPFIKYFTEEFARGKELEFVGNLHEISILNDEETEEFIGHLVHFYHGDNFCESFYGIIYFDEYPNFYEKIDSIEQNSQIEIVGRLLVKAEEIFGDYYYLEIHGVKSLSLDGENLL